MSSKNKVIAFRVSDTDFDTLTVIASRLKQMGEIASDNPNILAKQYTFAFANIVMKMHGWTQTTDQDNAVFGLARAMADTLSPQQQQQQQQQQAQTTNPHP